MMVKGYDTRLPEIDILIQLCKAFSSCGEVIRVQLLPGLRAAAVTIVGVGCEENAMALNETDEFLAVKSLFIPENKYLKKRAAREFNGYMLPSLVEEKKEREREREKEKEMEMEKKEKKKQKKMEKEKKEKKKQKRMEM